MTERHTLITNLNWVSLNGIRTYTHALLLTEGKAMFGDETRYQLRGFGTDPAWPTFDVDVPSLDHTLLDARGNAVMITDACPGGEPLITGSILQFKDGPRVDCITEARGKPLRFDRFEGSILQVWAILPARVREFWSAPNMPTLRWVTVRR